jgi:hypothetical protein
MSTVSAEAAVTTFSRLQAKLVGAFLRRYSPRDTLRFSDVPRETMEVDGIRWEHSRHGVGVTFRSEYGEVNAAENMVAYPGAIDAHRLSEYLQSIGVDRVEYRGDRYGVSREDVARLLLVLHRDSVLTEVGGGHPFSILYVPAVQDGGR